MFIYNVRVNVKRPAAPKLMLYNYACLGLRDSYLQLYYDFVLVTTWCLYANAQITNWRETLLQCIRRVRKKATVNYKARVKHIRTSGWNKKRTARSGQRAPTGTAWQCTGIYKKLSQKLQWKGLWNAFEKNF